jgi:hypothetical protein
VDGDAGGREVVAGGPRDRFNNGGDLDAGRFAGADGACDFRPNGSQSRYCQSQRRCGARLRVRPAQRPFRGRGR